MAVRRYKHRGRAAARRASEAERTANMMGTERHPLIADVRRTAKPDAH